MAKYLRIVKAAMTRFDECYVEHIPREENTKADAISKFASSEIENYAGNVYFQVLKASTIDAKLVAPIGVGSYWMDPIKSHLETGWLPDNALEAQKLLVRALRYALIEGILYKKSFVIPYLKCLRPQEVELALKEVHEGICGQYLGGRPLSHKITLLGFYWSEMLADAKDYLKRCDRCQKHAPIVRYGLPRILVMDIGRQFNNEDFKNYCQENDIKLRFTSVAHPQANGQAEVANRIILDGQKKKVKHSRNTWVDEILPILWAYRTTRATPFLLAYGAEVVVPLEITHVSPRVEAFEPKINEEGMRHALDLIDEVRDEANAKNVEHQKDRNHAEPLGSK